MQSVTLSPLPLDIKYMAHANAVLLLPAGLHTATTRLGEPASQLNMS